MLSVLLAAMGPLSGLARASDVFRKDNQDGSIAFTDSPAGPGFVRIEADHLPPSRKKVNVRHFPLLDSWDPILLDAAARYGLDANLLKAVCLAESGMNPNARSTSGAIGLMQLLPSTARGLGVQDPWDPTQNVDGGARYLSQQVETFGTAELALAAYHAGPGAVARAGRVPEIPATEEYVRRVLDLYDLFKTERPLLEPQ